jgi:PAS domain S-box-containing protein
LSAVIADLQITMAVHDTEGRIVLVNETWLRRTGLKREQVLGRRLPDIMPHPFFRFAQELVERVLSSGHAETIRDHYLMMRHDRPGGYIDGSVVPIRGPDGTFVGVVSATTDVTSKVLARHAVEAAHARLARILEHLPVGVFLVESERDGPPRWTLVNSTGQDYVWRGPGPIEDTGPVTVLDSEGTAYPPGESPLAQPRWTGPPPPPQEIVLRYPDGNDRVLLTTAAVVQSSLAHREAVIVAQDITDLKQAEAALRRSEERFVKAFRASPDGISITRVGDGRAVEEFQHPLHLAVRAQRHGPVRLIAFRGGQRPGLRDVGRRKLRDINGGALAGGAGGIHVPQQVVLQPEGVRAIDKPGLKG